MSKKYQVLKKTTPKFRFNSKLKVNMKSCQPERAAYRHFTGLQLNRTDSHLQHLCLPFPTCCKRRVLSSIDHRESHSDSTRWRFRRILYRRHPHRIFLQMYQITH